MTEITNTCLTDVSRVLRKLLLKFDNISGSELAKRAGVPVSTINRILAGTVIDPKISTLKPLANYFGISVDQLLGYAHLPDKFDRYTQQLKPTIALPVFKLSGFESSYQKTDKWFTWVTDKQAHEDVFAITIESNEFEPIFTKDSILIIEPSMLPPQNNDYLAVVFENDTYIAIRRYKAEGNDVYFVPLNPQFKAISCSEKAHRVLGVISEAHAKLREI